MIITLPAPSKKWKQGIKLALKIAITVICLVYISQKIDFKKLSAAILHTQPLWIVLGVMAFMLSKLFSSFRLNIYFSNINLQLSQWKNIKLYWLGMFYNLFLPGSIGGDAYKVVRLSKDYNITYRKTAAAVLLDRFSGLAALGLLLGIFWVAVFNGGNYSGWIIAGMALMIPCFYFAIKIFFPSFISSFWPTFAWGMAVQVLQVAAMYCILRSLNIHQHMEAYTLIFLASSVMAVLPFTIGGLGARELVFVWGAQWFLLDNTVSVTASALFYAITVVSSSFGLPFIFFDPLQNSGEDVTARQAYDAAS
jgi:uncharacterized membrane protein YbhN (UPF0104 family)